MHKPKLLLFLFCLNSLAHAEEKTLYDHILGLNWVFEGFDVTRTETGIDLDSEDTIKISDEKELSKVHINLEGPFPIPEGITLDQAINFNINSIIGTSKLNPDYPKENRVADGVGAIKVDVNGTEVGYVEYQIPNMNMAKFKRAIIVSEKGMYGFTMAFFDPSVEKKQGMVFDMLIIAAVSSGQL